MPLLLMNTRNHCYSNVAIQLLYNNITIRLFFQNKQYTSIVSEQNMPICDTLSSIFKTEGREMTSTEDLRVLVARKSGEHSFSDGSMQDSLEFLVSLLKMLKEEIPQSNLEGHRILDGFVGRETMQRKFLNTSKNGQCPHCQKIPTLMENPFRWLTPHMIDTQTSLQLQDLLDNYFTIDIAEMKCSACCKHLSHCPLTGLCRPKTINSTKFYPKAPDNLIIQVNRFNSSENRLQTVVEADEIIELPGVENDEKVSIKYGLSSVIDFIGESTNSGHYIVHVKGSNGWLECNDTIISPSSRAKLETNKNYIYHYSRMYDNNKIKSEKSKVKESKPKIGHTTKNIFEYPQDEINNESLNTMSINEITNHNITKGNKKAVSLKHAGNTKNKKTNDKCETDSNIISIPNRGVNLVLEEHEDGTVTCFFCKKSVKRLLTHLNRDKNCKLQIDTEALNLLKSQIEHKNRKIWNRKWKENIGKDAYNRKRKIYNERWKDNIGEETLSKQRKTDNQKWKDNIGEETLSKQRKKDNQKWKANIGEETLSEQRKTDNQKWKANIGKDAYNRQRKINNERWKDNIEVETLREQRKKDYQKWIENIGRERLNQQRSRKYKQTSMDKLMNTTMTKRREQFTKATFKGPIYICNCCKQRLYEKSISKITEMLIGKIREKQEDLIQCLEKRRTNIFRSTADISYICSTCKHTLLMGKLPAMAELNKLKLSPIPEECQMTELENNLIARTINYQKIVLLKKSRWAGRKGRMVSVPIPPEEMMNTIKQLPRLPSEAGLIAVKLKRKKQYTGHEKHEMISPDKIVKALSYLKRRGHPSYTDVDIDNMYMERCKIEDREGYNLIMGDVEDEINLESLDIELEENDRKEDMDIEEQETEEKDVVRKYHFNYKTNLGLMPTNPEVFVDNDGNQIKNLNFAPGEGKVPTNFLDDENWDINSWPGLHPDGKFGLHEKRRIRFTSPEIFPTKNIKCRFKICRYTRVHFWRHILCRKQPTEEQCKLIGKNRQKDNP